MAIDRAVIILHLSDMQFGRNHIFGRLNLPAPDHTYDTLAERLCQDLRELKESEGLQPDLIVVSGDMAEWGLPAEFDQTREFLDRVLGEVQLGRDRVVMVPGNHDINRKSCEAYFAECAAEGNDPVAPFWKKWKQFHAFFSEFYKDLSPTFAVDQPWTWFEIDELKLVVAGLNSTLAEIHDVDNHDSLYEKLIETEKFGHFGRVGEAQLRWFEEQLKVSNKNALLRIGVVHHNVRRGEVNDDENLRDAEDLFRILGPQLNLLLHGHTHNGKHDRTPDGVMILSTGSTALAKEARPDDVPNQYQFIRLEATRTTRWTRRYDIQQKRWVGDTRCSDDGRDWRIVHDGVKLLSVARTFSESRTDDYDFDHVRERENERRLRIGKDITLREAAEIVHALHYESRRIGRLQEFLARVAHLCQYRFALVKEIKPQFVDGENTLNYLSVTIRDDMTTQEFPVGVFEGGVSQDDLANFVDRVDARFRAANDQLISYLVYSGPRAPDAIVEDAKRHGVRLMSFIEFQGLIDFRTYLDTQTKRLRADVVYPGSLYVPQRLKYGVSVDGGTSSVRRASKAVETSDTNSADTMRDGLGGPSYKGAPTDLRLVQAETADALNAVTEWVSEPDVGRFVLLLGDFGTGKTFLLRELAKSLAEMRGAPVPILIELRELQKTRTVNELIAQHLVARGMENIDIRKFRYMLEHGRIALLFDGFDELAQRVTYDRATSHFDTLMEAAGEHSKIVVTSRTQHFISDRQVKLKLLDRAESLRGLRLGRLQPFDEGQIRTFLRQLLKDKPDGEAKAEERFQLIHEVTNLIGLSETPRMLSFIADLPEEQLREAKQRLGEIGSSEIYRLILNRWLEHEVKIANAKGSPPTLSVEERWHAVTQVAVQMWPRAERTMRLSELAETVAATIHQLTERQLDEATAAQLVGARTLLVRDAEGVFSFVHQSVLEWLVANRAADELKAKATSELLTIRELSPLMADFMCNPTVRDAAAGWAKRTLTADDSSFDAAWVEIAKTNALLLLERLGEQPKEPMQLAGKDLRGQDLSGKNLRGAILANADLSDARLIESDLTGANLHGANLIGADLRRAILRGANLSDANGTLSNFVEADLREAVLARASFRRTKFVKAQVDEDALAASDCYGAALPDPQALTPMIQSNTSPFLAVAYSPQADLLASGDNDGIVRLWDPENGQELRRLGKHQGAVMRVAFSPDGCRLASCGDDQTIRLWNPESGEQVRLFIRHGLGIYSVSFNYDGRWLASGAGDGTIWLWNVITGQNFRRLEGHSAPVQNVLFSADDRWLASGSDDGQVRLWDAETGREVQRLEGHPGFVRSLWFSKDGQRLASVCSEGTIRFSDTESGKSLRFIKGPATSIEGVSFSEDGRRVAIGGSFGTVLLWDSENAQHLHCLDGHGHLVNSVSFSPDGLSLASASLDATIRLWDTGTGKQLRRLIGHRSEVNTLSFSPDSHLLAQGNSDGTVLLWDVRNGRQICRYDGHERSVLSVEIEPQGQWLASGGDDNSVRLWDTKTGELLRTLTGHGRAVTSVSISADGRHLISGSDDSTVRLWDTKSGNMLRSFEEHRQSVRSVAFSPDGKHVASGGNDQTICLWNAYTGEMLAILEGHDDSILSVSFSADGRWLASASDDQTIRLWNAEDGEMVRRIEGHKGPVLKASFSPDGRRLASGGNDQTLRLWNAESGRELQRFEGHWSSVLSVAFSSDGRYLASGSIDGMIRLWDSGSGALVGTLLAVKSGWAAIRPDGGHKWGGRPAGGFWYMIGLCRFEPGELDDILPPETLRRVALDEPLF